MGRWSPQSRTTGEKFYRSARNENAGPGDQMPIGGTTPSAGSLIAGQAPSNAARDPAFPAFGTAQDEIMPPMRGREQPLVRAAIGGNRPFAMLRR
jgi:hypothetical protein